jgi:predicted phage terminase large subunit-like protein
MTETISAWEFAARSFEPSAPRWATPGDLAKAIDPATAQTAALDLIDDALVWAYTTPGARLLVSMPPQEGKLVADETPVPVPGGWTTHGALRAGDLVFHPSGKPVRVLAVSEPAEASLVVRTGDHGSVMVHPRHEWTVYDRGRGAWRTVETAYLRTQRLASGVPGKRGHRYRFQLPLRESLELPDAELPIEPYTLGVWLGDGSSTKAAVTHHPDDEYQLVYPASARSVHATTGIITTYYVGGMLADLRAASIFGNKHIPPAYLRGSEKQRRALLAGLVDTDGHVSASGQVSFDNADERLVRDTAELVRTLGCRAHVHRPTPPKLSTSGIQGKKPMWRVTWTPHDEGPARLARKAATKLGQRERVAIIAIDEAEPKPGRCVTVDSPDGLYLVSEQFTPTHNSTRVTKAGSLWALARNPETRIGIVSYAQSLADGFSRDIRNWIASNNGEEGTLDIGLRVALDYGSARRWQLSGHRGGVVAAGVGSGLTGRPLDLLAIDDPFADASQAGSSYYRDRVWDWWQSVGAPRLAPGAPAIVVLTRWHENDLAGRLLDAEDGHRWRVVNIPAVADHDPAKGQLDPLGRQPGEWLKSARGRTDAEWEQIRIQAGSRVFASLYQGRPAPDQGDVWQRQWWRRYSEPPWSQHPDIPGAYLVHDCDEVLLSFDCTFKATSGSDFVAGQAWMRRGASAYLLDQVHKRLGFTDTLAAFQAMAARWPQASRKLVEAAANGEAVIDSLRAKIPGIVAVKPKESKYARASAVSPFIEAGNVFLPSPGIALFDAEGLIEEAAGFPNAAHDDQVDAASQALAEMFLDGTGAQAWLDWAKRQAELAEASRRGEVPPESPQDEAAPEPETVPLDPVEARRQARNAMFRGQYR